jgi:hypothetical protein
MSDESQRDVKEPIGFVFAEDIGEWEGAQFGGHAVTSRRSVVEVILAVAYSRTN